MTLTLKRFCSCGGSIKASSTPTTTAEQIVAAFVATHEADGHRMVTQREAANARRREQRREQREYERRR